MLTINKNFQDFMTIVIKFTEKKELDKYETPAKPLSYLILKSCAVSGKAN